MKIRLISGSCYIVLLIAFYCLKIFVHDFFFDAFLYLLSLRGTYELIRTLKDKTTSTQRCLVFAFALIAVPAVALAEYFFQMGMLVMGLAFFVFSLAILCLLVVCYTETTLEGTGLSFLAGLYPTMLLCLVILANHATAPVTLEKFAFDSRLLILAIFVISPCADSIAYVFGITLRKRFPKKMTPTLSPNKTVIGGVGGLVGGVLGMVVVYFVYNAIFGSFDQMGVWLPVYLAIGLLGSIATEFGDLVESAIKRKIGVKDMGRIMPGHGGVLDRIDSVLFTTIVVYAAYLLTILCV